MALLILSHSDLTPLQGKMRGHVVIWAFSLYILALHICLGECQITFSRSWVRGGKLPGQTSFEGDYDQGGDSLGFVRASKALMEVPHNNNNNLGYNNNYRNYPRDLKSLFNLRGLFHKWKYSNVPSADFFNRNPSSTDDD